MQTSMCRKDIMGYGTMLQAVSINGHEAVVWLLLEKNVDTDAQGGHYSNALQESSIHSCISEEDI